MSSDVATEQWTTIITSEKKRFHLGLKELFNYRDLVWLFFKRDFTALYKQTILGLAWYIIQPLFTTIVFSFVFGNLAGLGTENVPSYLFYLSGIILWRFFADSLQKTSNTFLTNANLFGKVYFPRLSAPVSMVMSNIVALGIQLFLFILFYVYYLFLGMKPSLHWSFALFPVLILHIALLGTGLGLMVTSMTTKYRDLKFLVTFGLQLWMYATPIAYPLSEILEKFPKYIEWLFILNPIAFPIELFRFMLFKSNSLNWIQGGISIGMTLLFFLWGVASFNRVQQNFMDRI
ncbi:ABC transporter permease [Sediminispirochaeta smaragdinae]|uniref:Transport permease protein n=1 Tax=Sediminispirochaeta smaragdinae (strain DSM 11293 / JCM 15392 / SEBR 4228) TaxID=573413 RepID=E1RA21_SEDSS|nr:ABC transporter permease [Sediminispirochaeta smaragdinae]ADK83340.1 ABC-2 type transporter [Sediminispirochaeta smaragdinae DSM 11293]